MKKIYILPNLFTTANLFCGFSAIIAALNKNFINAAWLIVVAMLFDSMDGRVARLTRATSKFGVEYDSFSDFLSFGISPSLVAYLWCLEPFGRLGWLAAFLYTVCAALRLARFNVLSDVVPKKYFQGLPSPLAAATIATSIIFYHEIRPDVAKENFILAFLFILASLMISTLRFTSFKELKVGKENSFGVLASIVLTLILIAVKPEVTLFALSVLYITVGIGLDFYRLFFKKQLKHEPSKSSLP